jgi:D-alanine-D-alanine ligase-like ATP-grasp enzyme
MNQKKMFNDYTKITKLLPKSAKGLPLITYSITLEAWRRGIEVSLYNEVSKNRVRTYYSLKNGEKEYSFRLSFGGVMEKEARRIVNDKAETKKYLNNAGISVPKGKKINISGDLQRVITYADSIDYPVVAKPLDARNATGVFTNLKNRQDLEAALITLRDDLNYNEIILEQFISGEDTRVYVIEDNVIAAFIRRPANVIGDGVKNLKELIDEKNEIRQNNPHLRKFNIEINDMLLNYINESNLTLESVPKKNERVYLNASTIHPDGCETVDVTDELTDNIKSLAVNALKAVPGMKVSGIDIMVDHNRDEGFVLELNGAPNISGHIFPMEGERRDVPKALIDYHFPETVNKYINKKEHFVYDLDSVSKILKSGAVKKVTLPSLPKGELSSRRFLVSKHDNILISYINKLALRMELGGKFILKSNDKIIVKIAGEKHKVQEFTENLMNKASSEVEIKLTREDSWDNPYHYYFKPLHDSVKPDTSHFKRLKIENKRLRSEVKQLKEANQKNMGLSEELKNIKQSKSWKITKPLRKYNITKRNKKG